MMTAMLSNIPHRLQELNDILATCGQKEISLDCASVISLFYRDFNDTNCLVKEANSLAKENPGQLSAFSVSLLSETNRYLSLDKANLYAADFEDIFRKHIKPFELRYEEAKTVSTKLWQEYSRMSNRLDFLPLESEEYRSLEKECDTVKAEYDKAQMRTNLLYNECEQEQKKYCHICFFKPLFLDVLVERLKGISESIISDLKRLKEGKP